MTVKLGDIKRSKSFSNFRHKLLELRELGLVFAISFLFYCIFMYSVLWGQSGTPYYVHLADSLIHGQLHLNGDLDFTFDLISFSGKLYVPGGILPAILLTPFVAIWGTSISDVGFGIFVGAINVTLIYSMFRQMGVFLQSLSVQIWITILFAVGTVHWWVASIGGFWFLAHTVTVTFMILYVKETLREKWPGLAGLWLGLAVLSRPTAMFSIVFYFSYNYLKSKSLRLVIVNSIPFTASFIFCFGLLLLYNFFRFDNWFNFGYSYLINGAPSLLEACENYECFNLKYLPCNFFVSFFGIPNLFGIKFLGVADLCWHLKPIVAAHSEQNTIFSPFGLSIFLTTPTLLYLLKAKKSSINFAAGLGSLAIFIPLLLYHNTGYFQFGYRYILDFIVFIFIILSSCIYELSFLQKVSIVISILINFAGFLFAYQFYY